MIDFKLIFVIDTKVEVHLFACEDLIVPVPFVEQTVLFLMNCLGTLVKNQLIINIWIYLGTLNSLLLMSQNSGPWTYMSVFTLVICYLEDCSCIVSLTLSWEGALTLFFFEIVVTNPGTMHFFKQKLYIFYML